MQNNSGASPTSDEDRELYGFRVEVDDTKVAEIRRQLSHGIGWEYVYGTAGLLLGTTVILAGAILTVNGVYGSVSWTARFLQAQSQINDAGPGVVLSIIGLFLVFVTRPNIVVRRPRLRLFGVSREGMRAAAARERERLLESDSKSHTRPKRQ